MSTVFSPTPASLGLGQTPATPLRRRFDGARGLAALLLAAAVAALVVLADQLIDTWADGHLLLGWVALWVVIFAGSALLAGTARRVARRTMAALDSWSRSLAEARAQARLWEMAKLDPRLKAELLQARARDATAVEPAPLPDTASEFEQALAPLGLEANTAPRTVNRRRAQLEKRRINGYLPYL